MTAYTIRRLFLIIPTFFFIILIVFLSIRFIPSSIIDLIEDQLAG